MINVEEVKKIKTVYEDNFDNGDESDYVMDIIIACNDVIEYYYKMGTEIDTLTWGEFTNRYNLAMEELERLIKEES